jgi:O-6-methylguanine DNA methyltransferase
MNKQFDSTEFEYKVWRILKRVPWGRVTTYQALAQAIGYFRAARAVGNALHKNPWAPKVPCHRVVKSNGQIGGYRSGIRKKTALLKSEGVRIKDGKIVDFEKFLFKF